MINITTEARRDHAQAVQQLREMAGGLPSPPKFLKIDGWPAYQTRGMVPVRTRREAEEKETLPRDSHGRPLVRWQTTAIAAANLLVRIEATFSPKADPKLTDQVEAIGRLVRTAEAGDPVASERELLKLRNDLRTMSGCGLPETQRAQMPARSTVARQGAASALRVEEQASSKLRFRVMVITSS